MMIKQVPPGSWDWNDAPVQLVKASSRGLIGQDRDVLVKRAGYRFADEAAKLALPGEELIHLLAMGSTEKYGENRNFDGYRAAMLEKYHPTFVSHARFYRDHANSHPAKSYGVVKASQFNKIMGRVELLVGLNATKEAADRNGGLIADKEMESLENGDPIAVSMALREAFDVCLAGDSLISTRRGQLPISDVEVGDEVLTHLGRWRPVTKKFKREYSGTVVSVEVVGVNGHVKATDNHPFMVLREEAVRTCRGTARGKNRRHTFRDGDDICTNCQSAQNIEYEWVDAADIRCQDYLVYPVVPPGRKSIPEERAYLAGIYTGDGSLIWQRRGRKKDGERVLRGMSVTVDNDTPEIREAIQNAAKKIHGHYQTFSPSGSGKDSKQAHIYSMELGEFVSRIAGSGSYDKRLAEDVFLWNRASRLWFLAGCMDSDGSVDRGSRHGSGRYSSVNYELAHAIQKLWWGLGVPASLHSEETTTGFPGYVRPYPVTCYKVCIPRWGVALLDGLSVKAKGIDRPHKVHAQAFLIGPYMHLPVHRVEHMVGDLTVYNLAVEEDETYVAGDVVVHNCSGCNHKASNRSEYCGPDICTKYGGLKHNIGRTFADGHTLHADNPEIHAFFDISNVWRPADRTAWVLGRVKEAELSGIPIGGAEMAELSGIRSPWWLNIDDPATVSRIKLAFVLADLEKTAASGTAAGPALAPPGVIEALAKAAATRSGAAGVWGALAGAGCMLCPADFLQVAGGCVDRDAAQKMAIVLAPRLSGIYGRMTADMNTLEDKCAKAVRYTAETPPFSLMKMASAAVPACGLTDHASARRATAAVLHRPAPSAAEIKCPSQGEKAAESAATEYALYRLAALQSMLPDGLATPDRTRWASRSLST